MFNKLSEQGYVPIPICYKGKNPAIKTDWTKYCVEKPTQDLINQWQLNYDKNSLNIGITCGPASGIIVLDIDTDDKEILAICPRSPVVRRGSKGEGRFFRYSQSISSRSLPGLDILSSGRQTLIPPSLHPLGMRYQWLTSDTLMDVKPEDLPELDLSFLKELEPLLIQSSKSNPVNKGAGRNNKLVDIISSMRGRGEDESNIIREVYEWDRNHHNPRLFTDPSEHQFKAKTEDEAYLCAAKLVNNVTGSLLKAGLVLPNTNKVIISIDDTDTEKRKSEKFKTVPYPKARGIMRRFVDYCELTSAGKQDALGLGGAISLLSVLCSNRFNTQVRGLTTCPNTYTINIAPSSFGKEAAQKIIYDLLIEIDPTLMGGASYRSGSSIVMGLPKQQERLDLIDECSSLLRAMGGKEDYKSEIVEVLSSLYSKSGSKFLGFTSVTSGEKYGACWNPCVSMLGSTTPSGFRSSVNKDMAAKGLLPRFFLFMQSELGEYKGDQSREGAEQLYDEIRQFIVNLLSQQKHEHDDFKPKKNLLAKRKNSQDEDISEGIRYNPIVIPLTKEAHDFWVNYDRECHYKKAKDADGFESAFVGRFAEKTAKLALLDAISLGRQSIGLDSVQWGKQVVEAEWHNSYPLYELASAENKIESDLLRVLKIIETHGTIDKSMLARKTQFIAKSQRDQIINQLIEQNKIEIVELNDQNKLGRRTTVIRSTIEVLKDLNTKLLKS